MSHREEDYDSVHEQILENLEVDIGGLEEDRKFYHDNPSALAILGSKIKSLYYRAHKIRS